MRSAVVLFVLAAAASSAADFAFVKSPIESDRRLVYPPVVADVNGDGWPEPLGAVNDGKGNLSLKADADIGLAGLFTSDSRGGIRPSDARMADLDGDGCPDVVAQGYGAATIDKSVPSPISAILYLNDGSGRFFVDARFSAFDFDGSGEGLVVADFNNDGAVDIYLPYYTFQPCSPIDRCPFSPQSYLLLNDGRGVFREVAKQARLDFSTFPGAQPESVQAVDINNDGLLDVYIGGRIMINRGITNGVPLFQDCACGLPPPPSDGQRADEGAKFLDWNNDGKLDLVIHHWNDGPTLYENTGTPTQPFFTARLETDPVTHRPLFSTGPPSYARVPFQDSFGMNIHDLDNDGLEDMFFKGSPDPAINTCDGSPCPVYPARVFRNTGTGFELVGAGDFAIPGTEIGSTPAFGDINRDGRIDIIYPDTPGYYYLNANSTSGRYFVSVEMLGPYGERNQFGRVVRVIPQRPGNTTTYARVVDGGSGYHAQSQYPLLVGTTHSGAHTVQAFYPSRTAPNQSVAVTFSLNAGQYAQVFAPSAQYPNGRYLVSPAPLPPQQNCQLKTMLPLILDIVD